jgi:hypothetical protein
MGLLTEIVDTKKAEPNTKYMGQNPRHHIGGDIANLATVACALAAVIQSADLDALHWQIIVILLIISMFRISFELVEKFIPEKKRNLTHYLVNIAVPSFLA